MDWRHGHCSSQTWTRKVFQMQCLQLILGVSHPQQDHQTKMLPTTHDQEGNPEMKFAKIHHQPCAGWMPAGYLTDFSQGSGPHNWKKSWTKQVQNDLRDRRLWDRDEHLCMYIIKCLVLGPLKISKKSGMLPWLPSMEKYFPKSCGTCSNGFLVPSSSLVLVVFYISWSKPYSVWSLPTVLWTMTITDAYGVGVTGSTVLER